MTTPSLTPAADALEAMIGRSAALAARMAAEKPHLAHFFAAQHGVAKAMLQLSAAMHDGAESPVIRASAAAHILVLGAQCMGQVTDEAGRVFDVGAVALAAASEIYRDPSQARAESHDFGAVHIGPVAEGNA